MLLDFFNSPTKGGAHAVELNGGEGLEVQNDRPVADEVRQVIYMTRQVDVNLVAGLVGNLVRNICLDRWRYKTYRVSRE